MYKIIFVDDEALVKIGLVAILDWHEFGFDIVGEAKDGKDGLELINKFKPDLVITDIVMPEMNGIEMMKKAKEYGSQAIFVVLSSYDEFELVKQAMKIGAKDYILKMKITKEVLSEVLEEVIKEFEVGKNEIDNQKVKYEKTNWELEILRNSFFVSLLDERYVEKKVISTQIAELGIALQQDKLRVAYITTDIYAKTEKKKDINSKTFALSIQDIIKEICCEFFKCYCLQWEDGKYLIIFSDNEEEKNNTETIRIMLETVIEMLQQYSNVNASIGISERVSNYSYLSQAFIQAKSVLDNLFTDGYGKILFYNNIMLPQKKVTEIKFPDENRFQLICETRDSEEFKLIYEGIGKELEDSTISNETAKCQCSKCLYFIEEKLGNEWKEYAERKTLEEYMYIIYNCETVNDMNREFEKYCRTVYQFMMEYTKDDTYVLVREAKKYIKEHIYKSITLKEVADYLNISAGYLSGIFSKYEKIGFANYVNHKKILEAKQLFHKEHLKIYEVSFKMGYENSSYFSKIFKKYVGCTPKEYIEKK